MRNWRQTSTGLHRSVHTANTACAFSCALTGGGGIFFFVLLSVVGGFIEVIYEFLFLVLFVTDTEFEFTLLGAEHDGLAFHSSDHVEGRLGFAAQSQFQEVLLDAGLDGFAQFIVDLEEAVGRAKTLDALIGPLVVVVFDPEFDPLPGRVKALELGADQKVLPDRGPKPFDFAKGHRMLRPGLEVGHVILFEFGLEAAGAAPGGVLPTIVGEHLLGRTELTGSDPIDFDHCLCCGTAEQIRTHNEPGVIIHEGDEIRVTTPEPEREDVRLPHLVGRGPFEETRAGDIALLAGRCGRHQLRLMQVLAHGLRAGGQKEPATQQLADLLDARLGTFPLELDDLFVNRLGQLGLALGGFGRLQSRLAELTIKTDPATETTTGHPHLRTNILDVEALLHTEAYGFELVGG